jgi:hypothetical protein
MRTLEDVYTPSGDAVVVTRAGMSGRRVVVMVIGEYDQGTWYRLGDLTAREDLDVPHPGE